MTKLPPKSTGRERYGAQFKEKLCEKAKELDLQLTDVVRTATGMWVSGRQVRQSVPNMVSKCMYVALSHSIQYHLWKYYVATPG